MTRNKEKTLQVLMAISLVWLLLVAIGCAHQPVPRGTGHPGFFMGLLHGAILPFSLIGSIFSDVRIYAFPNSGGWYDFGFFLGVGGLIGGGASAS